MNNQNEAANKILSVTDHQTIDSLWEISSHGTKRTDVELAYLSGYQAALTSQEQQDHIPNAGKMVEVSEHGEGQENDCPECGAEAGSSCSSDEGIEYGRRVHEARQSQAQQTESHWISVDERLPEGYKPVLVATNFGDVYTCRLPVIIAKNSKEESSVVKRERFTHWMPLPPAPEGGDK